MSYPLIIQCEQPSHKSSQAKHLHSCKVKQVQVLLGLHVDGLYLAAYCVWVEGQLQGCYAN